MKKWMENIRMVTPYIPGEQPQEADAIKLNTNENPYPPAPGVMKAIGGVKAEELRRYPDCDAKELVKTLAAYHGVKEEQVFVGVGSDDVIAMCFMTFFHSKKPVLFPDVTYSFYKIWASMLEIPYEEVPLNEDWEIVPGDYRKENGGIIFPNPNAPTTMELGLSKVEEIVRENPDNIVVVDEAYIDFGGETAIPLLEKYDNLVITRTFSKARSLAGMRIGYAIGTPELIGYLNQVKFSYNSYTLGWTSIAAGTASIKEDTYFRETIQKIVEVREWMKKEMAKLGFTFPDSRANFLFVTHPDISPVELSAFLKENRIYVRYFKGDRTGKYLRVTIGTKEEMERFLECVKKFLKDR